MIDRVYLSIIFLIVLGGIGYVGYQKIQSAEDEINRLRENSAILEQTVQVSTETIDRLEASAKETQEQIDELQVELRKAEEYKDELNEKLREHNLTKLSAAKPGLIQKRVNDATSEIFKELEEITSNP
jgi:peptidoglycan hydrolase CwlO-like protein